MYVYQILNLINNKKYIGCTVQKPQYRYQKHLNEVENGTGQTIHAAIRKYGKENFEFTVLEQCNSVEEMYEREKLWISTLNTKHEGYNETLGGDGGAFGYNHTEETKQKISKANKGKKHTEEAKQKMSISRKGKLFTEEHKRNLKESLKKNNNPLPGIKKAAELRRGSKLSQEHNQKLTQARLTWWADEANRQKMIQAHVGKHHIPCSATAKAKISQSLMGKPQSEETRKKRSEALKKSWAARKGIE